MHLNIGIRAAAFLILMTGAGCGENTATVTGRVTYDGQPVTSGSVVFYGDDGRVDSGLLDANGKYIVTRAPIGPVKVAVMASKEVKTSGGKGATPAGPPLGKGKMKKASGVDAKPEPETVLKSTIPERYSDPQKSGLVYTVGSGKQVIDIDLKP